MHVTVRGADLGGVDAGATSGLAPPTSHPPASSSLAAQDDEYDPQALMPILQEFSTCGPDGCTIDDVPPVVSQTMPAARGGAHMPLLVTSFASDRRFDPAMPSPAMSAASTARMPSSASSVFLPHYQAASAVPVAATQQLHLQPQQQTYSRGSNMSPSPVTSANPYINMPLPAQPPTVPQAAQIARIQRMQLQYPAPSAVMTRSASLQLQRESISGRSSPQVQHSYPQLMPLSQVQPHHQYKYPASHQFEQSQQQQQLMQQQYGNAVYSSANTNWAASSSSWQRDGGSTQNFPTYAKPVFPASVAASQATPGILFGAEGSNATASTNSLSLSSLLGKLAEAQAQLQQSQSRAIAVDNASEASTNPDDPSEISNELRMYGANMLDFTNHEKPTLFELLRGEVQPPEQTTEEYKPFVTVGAWVLGEAEPCLNYYALWRPSVRLLQFMSSRLMFMPKIDLHQAVINPKLRRAILLVSSMQYRCHYCAAHVAGQGSLLKGSYRSQLAAKSNIYLMSEARPRRDGAAKSNEDGVKPVVDSEDPRNSAREADILRLVAAASRIPSRVTHDLKRKVVAEIGEDGLQMAAAISAFVGWTNAITDSVGLQLSLNDMLFASQHLGPEGWDAGRHAPDAPSFQSPPGASGNGFAAQMNRAIKSEVIPRRGLGRLLDYASIGRSVMAMERIDAESAGAVPNTARALHHWLRMQMGFLPRYVEVLRDIEVKRTMALALWVLLVRRRDTPDPCVGLEPCEWTNGAKALMWYVYTTRTGNLLLKGHAAFLAVRWGVPLNILVTAAAGVTTRDARLDAALDLMRAAASTKRTFPGSLNQRLVATAISPKGVMELVCTLGLFNMLHRLSAIVMPIPAGRELTPEGGEPCNEFEPEVFTVLKTFASVLNIDPYDASPQDKGLRREADPLQFLF
ncbi:hypothetical protein HK405_012672 [Cladochytrium tenue]|nr:hypothetical protein HK405_012672 [Cladochytrium tenue]